jgi:voltage-gated potassium channel
MSKLNATRAWGFARPPHVHGAAARAEQLWRWPVMGALLATIPAFYIEMGEGLPRPLAATIYAVASLLLVLSLWRIGRCLDHPRQYLRRNLLDVFLAAGLAVAAVLPSSTASSLSLAIRLGVSFLTLMRMAWFLRPWFGRGGLAHLMFLALGVLCICGVGFWVLEPQVHSLGDGLWLAFTTAATVGYGDLVPTTPASKIFAVFVVLLGYAVLSLVTAAIAAMWVETAERKIEQDILRDLHAQISELRREIGELRQER